MRYRIEFKKVVWGHAIVDANSEGEALNSYNSGIYDDYYENKEDHVECHARLEHNHEEGCSLERFT